MSDNSFTLFPLMVAGLVYQHSVRNRITIEAFSQFVPRTIIIDNKLLYVATIIVLLFMLGLIFGYVVRRLVIIIIIIIIIT